MPFSQARTELIKDRISQALATGGGSAWDASFLRDMKAKFDRYGTGTRQRFVGSLTGEGATKGVFVTTSDFSREAKDYIDRVQHRIVLINGQRFADLMLKHRVGVRVRATYTIQTVDEDYFA